MVDLASYKNLYIQTTKEYLDLLKKQLGILAGDITNVQSVEEAHRLVHTIKSRSLIMNHPHIAAVCKELEELFYQVKNNTQNLTADTIDNVSNVVDVLEDAVKAIEVNAEELDLAEQVKIVQSFQVGISVAQRV